MASEGPDTNARGPNRLLLDQLEGCGCVIARNFACRQLAVASVDLLHDPTQDVNGFLDSVAVRAAVRMAGERREGLPTFQSVDVTLSVRGLKEGPEPRRRIAAHIQSGAVWTAQLLARGGHLPDPTCRFCGAEVGDHIYLVWQCPCFGGARDRVWK